MKLSVSPAVGRYTNFIYILKMNHDIHNYGSICKGGGAIELGNNSIFQTGWIFIIREL